MKKRLLNLIIQPLLCIISLSVLFFGGAAHRDVSLERISDYCAQVVKTKTKDKRYCALSVDAPSKYPTYYEAELKSLFGAFRSGVVTYASAMNVNKEHDIKISGIECDSLSLVYVGAVGSFAEESADGSKSFRHYKYNFYTMFEDPVFRGTEFDQKHKPLAYISLDQANKILERRGAVKDDGGYSNDDYRALLESEIEMNIDGTEYGYVVWNIYYQKGFYYEGVSDILGEYILTSYDQPKDCDLRQEHKSLYFFNDYPYYNQFLIKYLNERFKDEKVVLSLVMNNIIDSFDTNFFLSFYSNNSIKQNEWIYYVVLACSITLISLSLLLFWKNEKSLMLVFLSIVSLFIPYLTFKLVYIISGDLLFFSQASCKMNVILITFYVFAIVLIKLVFKDRNLSERKKQLYEVSV